MLPANAPAWIDRLLTWLEPFESAFGHVAQRGAFRRYLLGLLSDSPRKSMNPKLARVSDPGSVHVQWNALHVRLIDPKTGHLLREHVRAARGWHRIDDRDQPTRTPPTTLALLARATTAGPAIGTLCCHLHAYGGAHGIRQILGVLALAQKHGVAVVDEAATTALDVGVRTYRFVRKYVERRPPLPLTLRQIDPLIRQLTLYRDLVDQKTGGSE